MLAACNDPSILRQILQGLATVPRFVADRQVPNAGGVDPTVELVLIGIASDDSGVVLNTVRPMADAVTEPVGLWMRNDGARIGVMHLEYIAGGELDVWWRIYDRTLTEEFAHSDDNVAGDVVRHCDRAGMSRDVAEATDLIASEIAAGALPSGAIPMVLFGESGRPIGDGPSGWLPDGRFFMTLQEDAVLTATGGGLATPFAYFPIGVAYSVIYANRGANWQVDDCTVTPPVPAVAARPLFDVTVSGGRIHLDGAPMAGPAQVTAPVRAVSGPY